MVAVSPTNRTAGSPRPKAASMTLPSRTTRRTLGRWARATAWALVRGNGLAVALAGLGPHDAIRTVLGPRRRLTALDRPS